MPEFTSQVISELGDLPQVSGVAGKGFLCAPYSVREAKKKMFSFTDIQAKGKYYEIILQCHEELITIPPPPILSTVALYQVTWRGATSPPLLSPLFQVVSLGLYFGDQAYLRSSWNVLDGFLVFVSLIDIVVSVASAGGAKILGVLRVLRLLRTLRPLRSEPHRALLGIGTN